MMKWLGWRLAPLNLRLLSSTGQVWSSYEIKCLWVLFTGGYGIEGVIDRPNGGPSAVMRTLNRSVVSKTELSHMEKLSIFWSILPSDSHM